MRFLAATIAICLQSPSAVLAGDLHTAAQTGDLARVVELLDAGADVNEDTAFGSPLHFAAMRGHVEVVLQREHVALEPGQQVLDSVNVALIGNLLEQFGIAFALANSPEFI